MKKTTKALLIGVCSLGLLFGGFAGGVYAMANEKNYLTIDYNEKTTEAFQGQKVELATVVPVFPNKVDYIFYTVVAPDGTRFEVSEDEFLVSQTGEYTVLISVVGNDGATSVDSYTISVTKSEKPIVTEAPIIPTAFIEGFKYEVPKAVFTDYNPQTPTEVVYTTSLIDEDGKESVLTEEFSPSARIHESCVQLKYIAKSTITGKEEVLLYEVPVLKAVKEDEWEEKYYDFDKMFVTEGVISSTLEQTGVVFYGENDFQSTYANALNASLSVNFTSIAGYDNFKSVVFTLTDYIDESVQLLIEVAPISDEESRVTFNSTISAVIKGSIKDYSSGFLLVYDNETLEVANALGDVVGVVEMDLKGKPFKGFPSNLVRMKVEAKGVYGDSAIKISHINGQNMNSTRKVDKIAPYLVLEKEMQLRYGVGENVILPKAIGIDVMSPNVEVSVNVTAPDGNPVMALNGVSLWEADASVENTFKATLVGEYVVQYIATDISHNKFSATYYTVYAVDNTPPMVTLKGVVKSEVALGAELTVPQIEYSDDLTKTEDLYVLITLNHARGNFERVEVGSKIKFEIAGTYHLCFTVIDSFKNMTTIERIIVCK